MEAAPRFCVVCHERTEERQCACGKWYCKHHFAIHRDKNFQAAERVGQQVAARTKRGGPR